MQPILQACYSTKVHCRLIFDRIPTAVCVYSERMISNWTQIIHRKETAPSDNYSPHHRFAVSSLITHKCRISYRLTVSHRSQLRPVVNKTFDDYLQRANSVNSTTALVNSLELAAARRQAQRISMAFFFVRPTSHARASVVSRLSEGAHLLTFTGALRGDWPARWREDECVSSHLRCDAFGVPYGRTRVVQTVPMSHHSHRRHHQFRSRSR
jgi:hypothetical protein